MAAASSPEPPGPILQVFNRYLEPGGEEAWVRVLGEQIGLPACIFESADWRRADAPPPWQQALLMWRNQAALELLARRQAETQARAWLFHNVFPVGSAALYQAAIRAEVPVIQYLHSFRPFSISGYLDGGEVRHLGHWLRTYVREIRCGAWQHSRLKTAWYAAVLAGARWRGWFRAIRAWIAPSDFMRAAFISAGLPAADVITLRHFWDAGPEPSGGRDARTWVFLGRLVAMKGLYPLLAAWEIVTRESGGRGPRLLICGAGELAPEVQAAAERNPLITACGHVSGAQKQQLLSTCSGLIAPSLCLESLGLVAYEAYDRARPVLAARSGALAEIVADGTTGRLHTPGHAEELAAQVLELDAAPARRRELGQAGRAWLLANTSRQLWMAGWSKVVQHALR